MKKIMQAAVFWGNGTGQVQKNHVQSIIRPDTVLVKVHC